MKLYLSYALLFGWMAVIFLLSSEGHDASSGRSDAIVETLRLAGITWQTDLLTFITRKVAHIVAYFVLGALALNVVSQHKLPARATLGVSATIVALYAISDEVHQLFVPGRSGELRDVAIDTVAGIVGAGVTYVLYRKLVAIPSGVCKLSG